MVGAVDSASYTLYAPIAYDTGERFRPFALYINDSYRVKPRLTLNMGLCWDYMPPFHEAENRCVGTFRTGYAIPAGLVAGSTRAWPMNRIDRSLSDIDVPQLVTFTSAWNLPFGKGHWGGGNPLVSTIVGGWAISDIFTYISGNPLTITGSSCNAPGQGTCMPSYAPSFNGSARQNGGWGHGATADTMAKIQYVDPNALR